MQTVTVTATSYSDYGTTQAAYVMDNTFDTSFSSPCDDDTLVTITKTTFTDSTALTDNYSDTLKTFRFQPAYVIDPPICETNIICDSVTQQPATVSVLPAKMQCKDFAADKVEWRFPNSDHSNQMVDPGTYEYEYIVCTGACTNPALSETFRVSVTLADPCINAQYTVPTIPPREYTITAEDDTFTPSPPYAIDPPFCGCEFILSAGDLVDDVSIDQSTQEITLAQITDSLALSGRNELPTMEVEKSYTVTLACRTQDYFGNDVDTSSVEYTQKIKDPCID